MEDVLSVYRWVLAWETPPSRVVLAGDSAGGSLTVASLLSVRDLGLPLPPGGVCLSPWVDLTNSAATYATRAATDTMHSLRSAQEAAADYLLGEDPRHPLASPVFAALSGLPLLILAGDGEVLLDDARTLAETASAVGVAAELFVYLEMPHVWMLNPAYPEPAMAFNQIAAFVARVTR